MMQKWTWRSQAITGNSTRAEIQPQPEPSIGITYGEAATIIQGLRLLTPIYGSKVDMGVYIDVGGRPVETYYRGSATISIAEALANATSLMV